MRFHRLAVPAFLILSAALWTVAPAGAQKNYPPKIKDAAEETYKTIGDLNLKLWVFQPDEHKASDERAAIVFFFGGGWNSGTPNQFVEHCRYLADQGMVAMVADYRVRSRNKTPAVSCVEDAESAVRWIRKNAGRLGIDPNRIAAGGGSAGGHLAACTGVVPPVSQTNSSVSSRPNALVLFNPAVILAPYDDVPMDPKNLSELPQRLGIEPKKLSPIHHVKEGLPPTIIFHGTKDTTVPFATVKRYSEACKQAKNRCELKDYKGQGHGFFNYGRGGRPGENYLRTVHQMHEFLQSLGYLESGPSFQVPQSSNVHLRSGLGGSRRTFEQGHGTVAFMGGSITENPGYRDRVRKYLEERFPKTEFRFVSAGISSTCSTTGAFRLQRDVLSSEPDLFFVEFAVNDDQDAMHSAKNCIRGMEGIIRNVMQQNTKAGIIVTHFVNPPILKTLQEGKTPTSLSAHERVAKHYGVSSISVANEVADRIANQTFTWNQYGGTHPKPAGYELAAGLMIDLLDTAWSSDESTEDNDRAANGHSDEKILPKPIDAGSYARGQLVETSKAIFDDGWTIEVPSWKQIPGSMRDRFTNRELLVSDQIGAEMTLDFEGTAIGLFLLAGPDAGTVEYSIDGGKPQQAVLFHRFSRGLHYPRTVMLADGLMDGKHRLTLRVSPEQHPTSKGNAVRILSFAVNGSVTEPSDK